MTTPCFTTASASRSVTSTTGSDPNGSRKLPCGTGGNLRERDRRLEMREHRRHSIIDNRQSPCHPPLPPPPLHPATSQYAVPQLQSRQAARRPPRRHECQAAERQRPCPPAGATAPAREVATAASGGTSCTSNSIT